MARRRWDAAGRRRLCRRALPGDMGSVRVLVGLGRIRTRHGLGDYQPGPVDARPRSDRGFAGAAAVDRQRGCTARSGSRFKTSSSTGEPRSTSSSFHHLFHTNPLLPVSPVFPGLELLTTALVSVSHVGLFPAGLIIVATSHVALAAAMFYLFRRVTGR